MVGGAGHTMKPFQTKLAIAILSDFVTSGFSMEAQSLVSLVIQAAFACRCSKRLGKLRFHCALRCF